MAEEARPLPADPYLKLPEDGDPYLEGHECGSCGSIFLGERDVCSKCGARDQMSAKKLSTSGKLHVYSIVHRSFPGIEVPYVSAIVDLDGGRVRFRASWEGISALAAGDLDGDGVDELVVGSGRAVSVLGIRSSMTD